MEDSFFPCGGGGWFQGDSSALHFQAFSSNGAAGPAGQWSRGWGPLP